MPGEDDKLDIPDDEMASFVLLVNAPSAKEAQRLRDLLEDHDIPSSVGSEEDVESNDDSEPGLAGCSVRGVQILVPKAHFDEAQEIIADIEDTDEFELNEEAVDSDDADDEFGFEEIVVPDDEDSLAAPADLTDQLDPADEDDEEDIEENN